MAAAAEEAGVSIGVAAEAGAETVAGAGTNLMRKQAMVATKAEDVASLHHKDVVVPVVSAISGSD